ncbi:MAG: SgcJ/EcaC family oxidoreductase [Isosphaeraceae bacterium]
MGLRTTLWAAAPAAAILLLATAGARSEPQPPGAPAAAPAPALSKDEAAVKAADEAFVLAYNKGDAKALAALFTEDAEVVEANGDRYEGRDLIEKSFADTFEGVKGAKLSLEIDTIRLISPDVAKEEGRSIVTPKEGAPVSRLYTVLYVKRDGRWLISSVREEDDPGVSAHERLMDLAWMVGVWLDESEASVVKFDCKWSDDGNFLLRDVTVHRQGKPVMKVAQRIGWDPVTKQVRSWEFDSDGGFGEGRWTRDGDRWVVKHTGTLADGTTASATNVMTRMRADLVRWVSADRIVGDAAVPEEESYVLVRTPPPPGAQGKTQTKAPTQSSNNPRSPR